MDIKLSEISVKEIGRVIRRFFLKSLDKEALTEFKNKNGKSLEQFIFEKVYKDAESISLKDPSQKDLNLILKTYTRGLHAVCYYRIANTIHTEGLIKNRTESLGVARSFSELAASLTTIDIHPEAQIGEGFFIDHGAGVVIGQTTIIGSNCMLFNNVILGSKNVLCSNAVKRHPTLKNNVTVCAGARVLGDITIGNNVIISPHAVVLEDIEDNKRVTIVNQLQLTLSQQSNGFAVYGIAPKFKNSFIIIGDGFYNPTVLLKLKCPKDIKAEIVHWDKNKIIVKIKTNKSLTQEEAAEVKIIVLSNSNKAVVLNNLAVQKVLVNIV